MVTGCAQCLKHMFWAGRWSCIPSAMHAVHMRTMHNMQLGWVGAAKGPPPLLTCNLLAHSAPSAARCSYAAHVLATPPCQA